LAVLGFGCTTTVLTPENGPTATYRLGSLTTTVSSGIDTVYQATEQAMQDLDLSVVQKAKDRLEAQVVARDAKDQKITVSMTGLTAETTTVKINAGSLAKSRRVYEAILAHMEGSAV
jgi:hypothetical protein